MEAIQFTSKSNKLELVNLPIPQLTDPKTVLIKVAYSGICGTDLHIIEGEFPCNPNKTFTLGHEFCGTVTKVGADIATFKQGDRVSVDPNKGCHCCKACRSGRPHFCKIGGIRDSIGVYRDGGWADYVLAPEEQVHKLPDGVSFEQAALSEPVSCLAHGWDLISPIHVGDRILVTGAGIIGSLWACALHHHGHRNVTVSEPNPKRLNSLRKFDTGFTLLTPEELKMKHEHDPDNYLFDLVIDCSGFPPAVEYAATLVNSGGKLCVFGVAPPTGRISIAPFQLWLKSIKIFGVIINPFSFPKSLGLLEAMGDKYLNYENLGIQTFALKDYKEAISYLKKGSVAKAIFKL